MPRREGRGGTTSGWLPVAVRDRLGQIAFIEERNPWAAIDVSNAIESAANRLAQFPHMGRPGRIGGTRELAVTGTPYVIAYRVEARAVVIVRLLHGAQKWPSRL